MRKWAIRAVIDDLKEHIEGGNLLTVEILNEKLDIILKELEEENGF